MREARVLVLCLFCTLSLNVSGCGSSNSPTAPTASAPPSADFAAQFDSLWERFDREYSYFVHKAIDWPGLRAAYRPRALAAGDQRAFIEIIRELLGNLHDGHVSLRDPGGAQLPTYQSQRFVNWDRGVWQQYTARAGWTQGQNDWGYGVLDGVPYIVIGGWGASSIRAADFDAAFERFRNAPALILDVRMNGGGDEQIAFDVAGRFVRSTVGIGSVAFRNGPAHTDFGPRTQRSVNPRGAWQYGGTVLLLVGARCASSNEGFIVAMGQLPNVTVAGDRTAGSTGNPGTFPLALGWSYTMSRWIQYTPDNMVIEDTGLAPDVFVAANASDFAAGRDPVLDWALNRLR